ncbi:MAG: phytoene desaturase family protein [Actinomycetota bacterium]
MAASSRPHAAGRIELNTGVQTYDAIVVGGGHNGLVCAAYLARAGRRVAVLERRELVGGASVTEEVWPGYRVSTAAYVVSLLQPKIVRDLQLQRHGYHVYPLDPAYFLPFPDGRSLLVWDDARKAAREIATISPRDADAYLEYDRALAELVRVIRPLLLRRPPAIDVRSAADVGELLRLAAHFFRYRKRMARLVDLMTLSVSDFLDEWFEDDAVKGALCPGGVIGAWGGPKTPGTAYVLLHHRMGEVSGLRGGWGFVRGGMGALSEAIAAAARAAGAEVRTNAEVRRVDVREGRAIGVTLADGTELRARVVVSGIHPRTTFLDHVGAEHLPPDAVREIERFRTRSPSAKVNVALSELPDFVARPGREPGPQHPEFIINPSIDYLERAWDDCKYGRPSDHPMMDCVIPTTKDPSLAPDGQHVMTCFVQYVPYGDVDREAFGDRVIDTIAEYAPNVKGAVLHRQVLTPKDLEERFGLLGGNIFHGEMSLDQLFSMRPIPQASGYRTPLRGLYLCGSGTHPGGGVMGAPGHNAARVIAADLRRNR